MKKFHNINNSSLRCKKTSNSDDSPQKNQTCVFPFIVRNVTYDECTKNHDKYGRLWCATKVDESGIFVINGEEENWGYCSHGT